MADDYRVTMVFTVENVESYAVARQIAEAMSDSVPGYTGEEEGGGNISSTNIKVWKIAASPTPNEKP